VHIAARNDRFDVVAPLYERFYGKSADELVTPLFQGVNREGERNGRRWTLDYCNKEIRDAVVRAELADTKTAGAYSSHSLRRGGFNEWMRLGLPLDKIKELGRWTSDAWKEYREETCALILELSAAANTDGPRPRRGGK